jgi:2-polyprenyl-3-methyl-5-hydroxy-6-metoxy-1,4-benzoquinol methylase
MYDLWLCLNCYAILNMTHLRDAQAGNGVTELQANSSDEFYALPDDFLANIPAQVDANSFIDFLLEQYPDCPRGTLLDFGAGRGITAGAAAKHFDRVYASELTMTILGQVHQRLPLRDKVILTRDYRSIPDRLDAVVAIHVLEHLPLMRDILDDLVERMNPGAALFFQVPLLRRDHLVCVHYTFFTEASCRALAHYLGLDLVGVWYAHDEDFLTCIASKPV